jgi:hypothetical protein
MTGTRGAQAAQRKIQAAAAIETLRIQWYGEYVE